MKISNSISRLFPSWKQWGGNIVLVLGALLLMQYPIFVGMGLGHLTWSFWAKSILILLPAASLLITLTKRPLVITVLVLLTATLAIETGMMVLYGSFLASGNIVSVFNTNSQEAIGFFSVALPAMLYWIPLFLLAALEIFLIYRVKISFSWNIFLTIILTIANLIAVEMNKKTHSPMGEVTRLVYIREAILCYPPYNTLNQIHITGKRYRESLKIDKEFSFGAKKVDATRPEKEIYILAIGESLRYHNFSLNGTYERSTTPRLETQDNLILFHNYYSPACLTAFSVPIMLTRATVQEYDLSYEEKSIIDVFQESDYHTFVIANAYNTLSEPSHLTENCDSLIVVQKDGEIPPIVQNLSHQYDKIFFVLHFLGNHLVYNNYTPEFDIYQPSVYNMENPPFDNEELNTNSYDNTILYTDYLLHTLIADLDSTNSVSALLFTPDHGENISSVAIGHGYSNHPPKEEYHIPLVIWYSDEWQQTYPNKETHIWKHQNAPINGENIFYSTYDMANLVIDSAYHHPEWSVFNDSIVLRERYLMMRDGVNRQKAE